MPNYLFGSQELEPAPQRLDSADDEFLFAQGPTRGLGRIQFPDWRPAFQNAAEIPNVAVFTEQAEALVRLVQDAPLTAEQMSTDLDFQQSLAQLFTLVPYAQLILEQAEFEQTDADVVDTVFETLIRDFTAYAIDLHGKASSTPAQQEWALASARKPVVDTERDERIYAEVRALADAYVMPA
jgi:acyl-CoA dehydrogenase